MDATLKIEGEFDLNRAEDYVVLLAQSNIGRLHIPLNAKFAGFAEEASYCQIITNAIRKNPHCEIETFLKTDNQPLADRLGLFVKKSHGFFASALAESIVDITGQSGQAFVSNELRSYLQSFRPESSRGQLDLFPEERDVVAEARIPTQGRKVFLPSIDGRGPFMKLLPLLYHKTGQIRSRQDFEVLTYAMLKRLYDNSEDRSRRTLPFPPDLVERLGVVVYELFDNTEKWATTDERGIPLDQSVRAIFVRFFDRLETSTKGPLEDFLSRSEVRNKVLLEISILDSGPGLASRIGNKLLGEDVSIDDEMKLVYRCMEKGYSSSGTRGRGIGLYQVLKCLSDLKGFLRLRTGRVAVYRDTVETPHRPFQEGVLDNSLLDWNDRSPSPKMLSHIAGTLFSMLIPVL